MSYGKNQARMWVHKDVKAQVVKAKEQLEKVTGRKITFDDILVSLLRKSESSYMGEVLAENARLRHTIEEMQKNRGREKVEFAEKIKDYVEGFQINGHKILLDIDRIPELNEFIHDPDLKLIRKVKRNANSNNRSIRE